MLSGSISDLRFKTVEAFIVDLIAQVMASVCGSRCAKILYKMLRFPILQFSLKVAYKLNFPHIFEKAIREEQLLLLKIQEDL